MKIIISAKNTELTDALKSYVEKKISKLGNKIDNIMSADVVLSVEKYRHIADVKLNIAGEIVKAQETSKDMYTSIDLIYEILEKQVEKIKDKVKSKNKSAANDFSVSNNNTPREPRIIEEEFIPKPLTIEEALMKLEEEKDKNFIIFNSSENGKVCILYLKKNGDFGYIVTR